VYNGVIPVYKQAGWTSHDVVAKIRTLLKKRSIRVGHSGTLDPAAEGVLLVCIGKATRIISYLEVQPKRYTGKMILGIATDTLDQTGKITTQLAAPVKVTSTELKMAFKKFEGNIAQKVPLYSACKCEGQPFYKLARKEQSEQLTILERYRTVQIYQCSCTGIEDSFFPIVAFDVTCSKGTYIRTLCTDVGNELGFPAHLKYLLRVANGIVELRDCYTIMTLVKLASAGRIEESFLPLDALLYHLPVVIIDDADAQDVANGKAFSLAQELLLQEAQLYRVYTSSNIFLAVYQYDVAENTLKPDKVFCSQNNKGGL
jgi:tRNA pseudouridine55 synthase